MLTARRRDVSIREGLRKPVLHWTFRACRYILCAMMRPWVARENSNGRGKTVAKAPAKKAAAVKAPEKLTSASMIGYLAEKNGLARKDVKQVLEDLFEIVGTGVMRGERVALGKIGKMFIRIRPARAARIGRNPADRPGHRHPRQAGDQSSPIHLQQDLQGSRAEGQSEEVGNGKSPARRGQRRALPRAHLPRHIQRFHDTSDPSPQGRTREGPPAAPSGSPGARAGTGSLRRCSPGRRAARG